MEEKINMIEDLIQRCEECKFVACEQCEINWNNVQAIKIVLEAYKQDEKMIDILIKYIDRITEELAREKGVEDFEFCDNRCADIEDYIECKDCIKEYFRKQVETNE